MMNGPGKKHSFSSSQGKGRKTDKVGANQGGARWGQGGWVDWGAGCVGAMEGNVEMGVSGVGRVAGGVQQVNRRC